MLDALIALFMNYGYYAVFGILFLCGLGIPIPEDITLVSGGILAGLGAANVHLMVVVAYLGVMVGDAFMFFIGYFLNDNLRQSRWFSKILSEARMARIDRLYARYNYRLLFLARFMPGVRSAAYVMAGMNPKIHYWQFLMIDGAAALVSVPIWVYLGFYGAENREWLLRELHRSKWLVLAALMLLAGLWLWHWQGKRARLQLLRRTRAARDCNRKKLKAQAKEQ